MAEISQEKLDWARNVLELPEQVSLEQLEAAWKRAVKQTHPDHGGSDEEARQVMQARDILLEFIRHCPCELKIRPQDDWWHKRFTGMWHNE